MSEQPTPSILDRLAAALHDLWRADAELAGWRHGDQFDPTRKHHDALVPYEELAEEDRVQLRLAIESHGVERLLREAVQRDPFRCYPRGPARPFARGELRVGTRVRYVHAPDTQGRVVSWTSTADGRPESITVRWSDGEEVEYANQERCLARVQEPG